MGALRNLGRMWTCTQGLQQFTSQSCRSYSVSKTKLANERDWKPIFTSPQTVGPRFTRKLLNDNAEKVALLVCGKPNFTMSTNNDLRYGKRGSLSISLKDEKSGIWFNFESGETGDMLDLVQLVKNLSPTQAKKFADTEIIPNLGDLKPSSSEDFESELRENLRKSSTHNREVAQKLISESLPLENSIAEKYLKIHRKITVINSPHLRFHPSAPTWDKGFASTPALIAVASTPNSKTPNVQVTYLDQKTFNKRPNVVVAKRTYGSFRDPEGFHMCSLNEVSEDGDGGEDSDFDNDVTFVSEGVETGLSVVQAFPNHHHFATLGKYNFNNLDTSRLKSHVVLVWDNDGVDIASDPVLLKCAERLLSNGKKVSLVCPPLIKGKKKTDMNDVLRSFGSTGVKNIIKKYKRNIRLD